VPLAVDDTLVLAGKEVEKTTGHVEATKRTARALVHNCSRCRFATVADGDRLETVRTRIATAELRRVQRDDKVRSDVVFATCTKANVVEREPGVVETLAKLNHVARRANGDVVVATVLAALVVRRTHNASGEGDDGRREYGKTHCG